MKTFLIYESRYQELIKLINDKNYKCKIMGEITWFLSLIKTIEKLGFEYYICPNSKIFKYMYIKWYNKNLYLIMDYLTIPKMIKFLSNKIDNIYCMCYCGRDENTILHLGKNVKNKTINLKNILTPFDYKNQNTYLGYNLDIILDNIISNKYNQNYGVLWGKDIEYINLKLVEFLCSKGVKFYATSINNIHIQGIENLNILPRSQWFQLLFDCKFIIGFGTPLAGPTILEALYYKKPIIGPSSQFPISTHNNNIHFTDNLSYLEIYNVIENIQFIDNIQFKDDVSSSNLFTEKKFIERLDIIFK